MDCGFRQMRIRAQDILVSVLTFGLLAIVHLGSWERQGYLNYDEIELIQPICESVGASSRLVNAGNHSTVDIQPVRDFTYRIDCYLSEKMGQPTFALTNTLLVILVSISIFRLSQSALPRSLAYFVSALFLLHPILVPYVAWWMGRKHVLALFFLLLSLTFWNDLRLRYLHLSSKAHFALRLAVVVCFGLSLGAHPSGLGWGAVPILLLLFQKKFAKDRPDIARVLPLSWSLVLVAIAGGSAYLNFQYYSGSEFLSTTFGRWSPKFVSGPDVEGASRFLYLCRALVQTLFPVQPEVMPYSLGSEWTRYSWLVLPIYLMLGVSVLRAKGLLVLLFVQLIAFVHLAPTTIFSTNTPASDIYLGPMVFGVMLQLTILWERWRTRFGLIKFALAMILILILFTVKARERSRVWKDSVALWSSNLEEKGSVGAVRRLARELIRTQDEGPQTGLVLRTLYFANPRHLHNGYLLSLAKGKASNEFRYEVLGLEPGTSIWLSLWKIQNRNAESDSSGLCDQIANAELDFCAGFEPGAEKVSAAIVKECSLDTSPIAFIRLKRRETTLVYRWISSYDSLYPWSSAGCSLAP